MNSKEERYKFHKHCFMMRKDIRFQNWKMGQGHKLFNDIKNFAWYKNEEFLRYSIETNVLTEMRLDFDLKDEQGHKDIFLNIKTALDVCEKLRRLNWSSSFYYSGGSGVHIHLLLNINNLGFLKFNDIPFKLKDYEAQFRKETEEQNIIEFIKARSDERKRVKELIAEFLDFHNLIDINLLSSQVMLTSEGYEKRNSTTNLKKIYVPSNLLSSLNDVIKYIEDNKKTICINTNYFKEINYIEGELLTYLNDNTKPLKAPCNPLQAEVKKKMTYNTLEFVTGDTYKKPDDVYIIKNLEIFGILYKRKNLSSKNKFYMIVVNWLYHNTRNKEKTLMFFQLFLDKYCINNLSCSAIEKVNAVIPAETNKILKIFVADEYLTKQEFFTEYKNVFGGRV